MNTDSGLTVEIISAKGESHLMALAWAAVQQNLTS
jgi:hypothetical protein